MEVCVYIVILSILLYYNTDQVCTCKHLILWNKELEGFNLCSPLTCQSESPPKKIKEFKTQFVVLALGHSGSDTQQY